MMQNALMLGDRREQELMAEITRIYSGALEKALVKQQRFFKKIEDIESGKYKPPQYYVQRNEVARWRQGFVREALRQEQVIQHIMKVLNAAGKESAALMVPFLVDIYRYNRAETVDIVTAAAQKMGVVPNFALYDVRKIKILLLDGQSPFSKIAYKNMGKNLIVRNRLQREFAQAIILGESPEKMRRRVQAVTKQCIWQARRVAQTERTRVQGQAKMESSMEAEEMGINVYNEWIARMRNTRDTHAALNGQKRLPGEPFESPSGALLRYPGDPSAPPEEVINCYCQLRTRVMMPGDRLVGGEVIKGLPSGGDGGKIDWGEAVFTNEKPLEWHWGKHHKEFPGFTAETYLASARRILLAPLKEHVIEQAVRSDGSISRYEFATNMFVATTIDGEIRTFMRPKDKEAYWEYEFERNK